MEVAGMNVLVDLASSVLFAIGGAFVFIGGLGGHEVAQLLHSHACRQRDRLHGHHTHLAGHHAPGRRGPRNHQIDHHFAVSHVDGADGVFARSWSIGTTTLWIAILLSAYVFIYYIWQAAPVMAHIPSWRSNRQNAGASSSRHKQYLATAERTKETPPPTQLKISSRDSLPPRAC